MRIKFGITKIVGIGTTMQWKGNFLEQGFFYLRYYLYLCIR